MNANDVWRVYTGLCKGCGKSFTFSQTALDVDTLRGLSPPARCPECRKRVRQLIGTSGARYWNPPRALMSKNNDYKSKNLPSSFMFGLAKLTSNPKPPEAIEYSGHAPKEWADRFGIIEPAVQALIANLENPNGTKVSILVGPTGTGKSVWATYRMLQSRIGREGRICVTQPRKITLKVQKGAPDDSTTPGFISKQLLRAPGVGAGHEVGFLYRGERTQQDRYTKLLFVTDGVLIRWIVTGEIANFSLIVIDEAHEQSTNMELIFALLRYKLPLYPRLRLVIASATVDVEKFRRYFGEGNPKNVFVACPSGELSKTRFPIYERWPESYLAKYSDVQIPKDVKQLPSAVAILVKHIRITFGFTEIQKPLGDILVFVPTISLLKQTVFAIQSLKLQNIEVLACYADMSSEEFKAFRKSEKRAEVAFKRGENTSIQRVIVATNYAETSVTLTNLVYVIDGGWTMDPQWDPRTCSFQYPTIRHTQAGCTQRKGRVGRQQAGEFFPLYTKEEFENPAVFSENPVPEIGRSPVDRFLLTAKAAGVDDLDNFEWLGYDAGSDVQSKERQRALHTLNKCGAIDSDGDITNRGLELERLETTTVDLALFVSESDTFGCTLEVATFLAFSNQSRSLFVEGNIGLLSYERWRQGCVDDLEFYLRIFSHWEKRKKELDADALIDWCCKSGLNPKALEDIACSRQDIFRPFLLKTHTSPTERVLDLGRLHRVRFVVAKSIPEWVFVRDSTDVTNRLFVPYLPERCPCNEPIGISGESACLAVPSISAFVSIERQRIGKMVLAKHLVQVDPQWLNVLTTASVVKTALLLKKVLIQMDDKSRIAVRKRITVVPKLLFKPKQVDLGRMCWFTAVRYSETSDENAKNILLAYFNDTKDVVLLSIKERTVMLPGARFRSVVESFDAKRLVHIATQQDVYAEYPKGVVVDKALVQSVLRGDNSQEAYAWLIQLEPGIIGKLSRRELGRNAAVLAKFYAGGIVSVRIKACSGTSIELEPIWPALSVGNVVDGYCVNFLNAKNSHHRIGAFFEIAPNVDGFIHKSQIALRHLDALYVGYIMKVKIISKSESSGKIRYELMPA